jgi:hypothetical protein
VLRHPGPRVVGSPCDEDYRDWLFRADGLDRIDTGTGLQLDVGSDQIWASLPRCGYRFIE